MTPPKPPRLKRKVPKRMKHKETWDDESLRAKDAIFQVGKLLRKLGYTRLSRLYFDHWEFVATPKKARK
jgi:hypothetical protein